MPKEPKTCRLCGTEIVEYQFCQTCSEADEAYIINKLLDRIEKLESKVSWLDHDLKRR